MTEICNFSFSLQGWNIVCNKSLTADDWKQGYTYLRNKSETFEDFAPKLAFLPPLKRRRLSDSARLFFEAAWDLVGENADMPVVYASSNSEMNRNFALWHSLLKEGDVSPTSFSLSVHNALIGQWSELRQVKSETTSIMARVDNLETALLEATLLLNEGHKKVLVVIAESPLEAKYNAQPVIRTPLGYALALVVTKGEQYQLTLTDSPFNHDVTDNALTWVSHQYLESRTWHTPSGSNGTWLWQKN